MRNEICRFAVEQLERRRLLSAAPYLWVSDLVLNEGNVGAQNAQVTVSLSHSSRKAVSVNFRTEDGSARAGDDYQAMFGTLKFAPGEIRKTIAVAVYGDRLVEPNEAFSVVLSGAVRATIADDRSLVTIIDDEPRISISGAAAAEGNAGTTLFNFTVGLSAASDGPVTVNYATADGAGATADSDYLATSGTLTFAPGETTRTIAITVLGDTTAEGDEGFYVILSGASANASMSNGQSAYGSIQDDDGYYDNYDFGPGTGGDYWSYWPGYYWY
jgi:chitinase